MRIFKEKIVIGIDPGTNIFGFGIIKQINNKFFNLKNGVLHLGNLKKHSLKLKHIFLEVNFLLDRYKPDELAIEAPFLGLNVQSMLKLGKVIGVVTAASILKEIPVIEYAPKKIKTSITGDANASKETVQKFVKMFLNLKEINNFDASDALATAICHITQKNSKTNKNESWKEFLKDNPTRII